MIANIGKITMKANIGGVLDVSTVDFPQSLSSVVFFCGCPLKCPFCQNWKLFMKENCKWVEIEEILLSLKSNFLIEAVTVTGGEPTLQIDALAELLKGIKSLGLATKIDTSGFFPNHVRKLVADKLLDYAAMDVKAPLKPEIYGSVVGLPHMGHKIVQRVRESLRVLAESDIPVEVRTTIVPSLIGEKKDIECIAKEIQGVDLYVLQQFRPEEGTLDPKFKELPYPPRERLAELAKIAKRYLSNVKIRTIEKGEERI